MKKKLGQQKFAMMWAGYLLTIVAWYVCVKWLLEPLPDFQRWPGHRIFAVDGSKLNLPRPLLRKGYRLPSESAHSPQGLWSGLYALQTKIPMDFALQAHAHERRAARDHLAVLADHDVVVYDRGYYS